jgi:hypothetical protein
MMMMLVVGLVMGHTEAAAIFTVATGQVDLPSATICRGGRGEEYL